MWTNMKNQHLPFCGYHYNSTLRGAKEALDPAQNQLRRVLVCLMSFSDDITPTYFVGLKATEVYDYFLTLDRERMLVWRSPWSFSKLLFLLNRYSPILDIVVMNIILPVVRNQETCHKLVRVEGWLFLTGAALSESIATFLYTLDCNADYVFEVPILLRTWAVLGAARYMLIILVVSVMKRSYVRSLHFRDGIIAFIGGFRKYRIIDNPLLATMVYDGLLNYIVTLAFTAANLAITFIAPVQWRLLFAL
ncbi:hypothetical protein Clacol_003139 [Clathrus columnatus]|uniref:DUF6533 domain-containing protein n=1 Tax=Clathrus columnatus TaxID=1419009 RepID=A0AAV5A847_9AGAM|nr:hypothetical protein Clacol_003139 [Clathrus columnatus]